MLGDQMAGLPSRTVLHAHGVVQSVPREALHAARERGREQEGLSVGPHVVADGADLRLWKRTQGLSIMEEFIVTDV